MDIRMLFQRFLVGSAMVCLLAGCSSFSIIFESNKPSKKNHMREEEPDYQVVKVQKSRMVDGSLTQEHDVNHIVKTQYDLGVFYLSNQQTSRGSQQALHLLQDAANQGHTDAMYQLGYMYYAGNTVKKEYQTAFKWFLAAAQQGHAGAQNNVAFMYEHALGIDTNIHEAFRWYKSAAQQNDSNAQFNLAHMYYSGRGVHQNYKTANYWMHQAAEHGHKAAQRYLSLRQGAVNVHS